MKGHLTSTTNEVVARLNKDWAADVRAYDEVYRHILMMSDALSDGIVKQFPNKFGSGVTSTTGKTRRRSAGGRLLRRSRLPLDSFDLFGQLALFGREPLVVFGEFAVLPRQRFVLAAQGLSLHLLEERYPLLE
jgi:hypothetical protein